MTRLSKTQYDLRVFAAMTVYVALVVGLLPQAQKASAQSAHLVYSLAPTLPLLYVVWLMGKRILSSDELEQRTHLIGLGVASAIVGVFSLIGGFLAITGALSQTTTATLLLWVFPLMLVSYGFARLWAVRRYGSELCDDGDGIPVHTRCFIGSILLGATTLWAYWRHADDFGLGMLCGMTGALAVAGTVLVWRRRRRNGETEE
jgi:hypothetical protein